MVAADLVLSVGGRGTSLPLIYTLTGKGRTTASVYLEQPQRKRFRPSEVQDKVNNPYFMQHTLAVNDVLIGAKLLSHTVPGIVLNRLITEPELKRKIYVEIPERICIEPDASVQFLITETWHEAPQIW